MSFFYCPQEDAKFADKVAVRGVKAANLGMTEPELARARRIAGADAEARHRRQRAERNRQMNQQFGEATTRQLSPEEMAALGIVRGSGSPQKVIVDEEEVDIEQSGNPQPVSSAAESDATNTPTENHDSRSGTEQANGHVANEVVDANADADAAPPPGVDASQWREQVGDYLFTESPTKQPNTDGEGGAGNTTNNNEATTGTATATATGDDATVLAADDDQETDQDPESFAPGEVQQGHSRSTSASGGVRRGRGDGGGDVSDGQGRGRSNSDLRNIGVYVDPSVGSTGSDPNGADFLAEAGFEFVDDGDVTSEGSAMMDDAPVDDPLVPGGGKFPVGVCKVLFAAIPVFNSSDCFLARAAFLRVLVPLVFTPGDVQQQQQ